MRQRIPRAHLRQHQSARSGTVLIVAMWIVLVLAGLVLVFARAMRVEAAAAANYVAGLQADAIAKAALQIVISEVDGIDGATLPDVGKDGQPLAVGGGWFWILNPISADDATTGDANASLRTYGVRDEASRLNLNTATPEMLLKLPNMTAEIAASIADWRDGDSDISAGGAESEYYLLLPDPYTCKNGPFDAVEELLLVRDVTRELLLGEDTDRNGVLGANENDGTDTDPADNRDGHLDRGWIDYLTVHTVEPNVTAGGETLINVNDANTQALSDLLRSVVAQDRFFQTMDRVRSGRPYSSVLDFYARTGLTAEEFGLMAYDLTASRGQNVRGLVNVNTAPKQVLLCLPGIEESDADALISKRQASGTDLTSVAWVAEALSTEKAGGVGEFVTTRSFQFSADIVAVDGHGRAFRRFRAVVDATTAPPRVLAWKDLTHLGWPLDAEIMDSLRKGTFDPATSGGITAGAS